MAALDGVPIYFERLVPLSAQQPGRLPMALLAPLGLNGRLWQATAGAAADAGYVVITTDNRGSGRSGAPRRPWTIATMARDVVAVLDHLGVDRAHVCGPSLGGLVAQELAIAHPRRVAALVLAATTPGVPRFDLLPWRSLALGALARARHSIRPRRTRDDGTREFLRLLISAELADKEAPGGAIWRIVEAMSEDRTSAQGHLYQLTAGATYRGSRSRLSQIQAPTQVQHGTADRVIPVRAAHLLARRIPNATVNLHLGAGHALVLERPMEAQRAAIEFVAAHERRRAAAA